MRAYCERHPHIRYIREAVNSGIDQDYDKAVGYAGGEYCWLMTDDDLLKDGALATVLRHLDGNPDLVVVNAEVRDATLQHMLNPQLCPVEQDTVFQGEQTDMLFACAGQYLSFIGGVVVRRALWKDRDRQSYFGSLFVHVGTLFQRPLAANAVVVAEPLIVIRYGNAMWTARGFEIWMFKWPALVWSLAVVSDASRGKVTPQEPWRDVRQLLRYRATGAYSWTAFRQLLARRGSWLNRLTALAIALCPGSLANAVVTAYLSRQRHLDPMLRYDLLRSANATRFTRLVFGEHRE
jgi:abequosyltransferase